MQCLLHAVEDAHSRTALLLAAWQVARVLTVPRVEAVLAERARRPTAWPPCPACGGSLRSKGCATRQRTSRYGPIRWQRRVGRCPQGCALPQVAPVDAALGVQPPPRTSEAVQSLGGALAVFVPFATAATLLGVASGVTVSPRAGWDWVQAAGPQAMEQLQEQLQARSQGHGPTEAPLAAELAAAPFLRGAEGVRGPCRPAGGHPQGNTAWQASTGGVLARLGRHRTRTGTVVARLQQRRLGAVVGEIAALQRRWWLAAMRQGIRRAPQVVWRSDGARGWWRLCAACCTGAATGLLDLYHAVQHLGKGAAAWLDGRTSKARRWFLWARHRLRHGNPDGVLADLAAAVELEG